MKQDELKTKVFEALGQASMCWSETPKGVFDSELALKIGNELMEYLLSKKPSVSDCMKVQIVGSLLDLLTPTKEERKDDYNKAQDRGASTNSFK